MREYPYRITLRMYSGMSDTHYIKANNYADAFSKAHRFANPIAYYSHTDGVQFIDVKKLTVRYCSDHHITFE